MLREPDLVAGEEADAEPARAPQELVHRRLDGDRDADERGSSDSETSEPTVRPSRWPSASTVTTATPAGTRRITVRSSSPPATAPIIGAPAGAAPATALRAVAGV